MGTIAARDALRVLTLTEQVAAAALLAVCQAVELRQARDGAAPPAALAETLTAVRRHSPPLTEDRPLEHELRDTLTRIRERHWSLYEPHP